MSKDHSKVAYQVMWNRLISVVEEQAQALVRTAFSTSVREAGDLSAGVYDTHGKLVWRAASHPFMPRKEGEAGVFCPSGASKMSDFSGRERLNNRWRE